MAFIRTHRSHRPHPAATLRAGRKAVSDLWARSNMTPQQRATAYALSTAPAVLV